MQTSPLDVLISGCRKGDRKAQEAIYNHFAARMLAVCRRYTHNTMEAEDILQESFIKVFTKIHLYTGDGSFEGWVHRIMVNTALTVYRQNQRQVPTCDIDNMIYSFPSAGYVVYQESTYLHNILKALNEKYRIPFSLFAIEGYSHEEIADKMGISALQSRVRVCRARTSLRESVSNFQSQNVNRKMELSA
jgi:RNA polymerase sigma factor (sigma-70 family)